MDADDLSSYEAAHVGAMIVHHSFFFLLALGNTYYGFKIGRPGSVVT